MPVLSRRETLEATPVRAPAGREGARGGLLEACGNPRCGSGWLHLWRSRSAPVFEGGWNCSPACTEERMLAALRRELEGRGTGPSGYRHRMPLGLVMIEQGWITSEQLKRALEQQRAAGGGRLGQFLVRQRAVSESLVTRALSLQWSCPVLPLPFHDPEALSPLLPRLFIDAFGALPLRVAAGKLVYLGFEERLDTVLALALERMSGLRVENGLVQGSEFHPAHERMLKAAYPPAQLLEASSQAALARALARAVERGRPVESRLVRVHDCLWLRMWKKAQAGPVPDPASVEDVIGSVGD
jgi:Type II secretion system (T2SS), protein E, N-terminal domain